MIPSRPGSYVLIMRLGEGVAIDVGQLGRFQFAAGWYAYAGSARGPGGLAARISRHLRPAKALHWHVDYLRAHAELTAVWYTLGSRKQECDWACALGELPGAWVVAPGFGASDCRCKTHLLYFPAPPDCAEFALLVDDLVQEDVFYA